MSFELPNDDIEFLNLEFNNQWEYKKNDAERGIIIKNYPILEGYSCVEVSLMILVPQNYPVSALDMFYVLPEITKTNGNAISALENENHFDIQWQRWSRHYNWQAGIHNIATHLTVVKNCLKEELQR